MLKTISAALLAASVLAAPAFAAESAKTTADTPVIKTTQTKSSQAKTTQAKTTPGKVTDGNTIQPTTTQAKPDALNSNAKMGKHHRKHISYRHRHHGKMAAIKTQPGTQSMAQANGTLKIAPNVSLKPAVATSKRG